MLSGLVTILPRYVLVMFTSGFIRDKVEYRLTTEGPPGSEALSWVVGCFQASRRESAHNKKNNDWLF